MKRQINKGTSRENTACTVKKDDRRINQINYSKIEKKKMRIIMGIEPCKEQNITEASLPITLQN